MSEHTQTEHQRSVVENVEALANDQEIARLTSEWTDRSLTRRYSYNFEWLGRPIINTRRTWSVCRN